VAAIEPISPAFFFSTSAALFSRCSALSYGPISFSYFFSTSGFLAAAAASYFGDSSGAGTKKPLVEKK
jgi:hypothetical protein